MKCSMNTVQGLAGQTEAGRDNWIIVKQFKYLEMDIGWEVRDMVGVEGCLQRMVSWMNL